jgi:hypothetical protein
VIVEKGTVDRKIGCRHKLMILNLEDPASTESVRVELHRSSTTAGSVAVANCVTTESNA